jgi:AcrR family transcriptional regulator
LLLERGYRALTLVNIRQESGENAAAVSYYFGDKAGLIEALVDAVFYEAASQFSERLRDVPPRERAGRLLEAMRTFSSHLESFTVFFELLPHVLRNRRLHDRLLALYEWYLGTLLEWIETADMKLPSQNKDVALGLAALITAVTDGLWMQYAIDARRLDVRRPYAVFGQMLQAYLETPGRDLGAGSDT